MGLLSSCAQLHKYNESLVRRGEVLLLDFDVIDNWHSDLDGMNEGKEGAVAYRYPDSFICSTSWLYGEFIFIYHIRQAEGVVVRAHANDKIPSVPNYSIIINRRINKLDIKISERIGDDIVIVLDSTGIKVTNRGEWLLPPTHKMECEERVSQDTRSSC